MRWNLYLVIVNLARVQRPTLNQNFKIKIVNGEVSYNRNKVEFINISICDIS